jgi:carboxylesterase type B
MQILDAIKSGQYAKGVPLLVGTNQDEGATFLYAGVPLLPMFVAQLAMSVEFGSSASKVLDFYAPLFANASADGREPIARVMTDYWFRCSSQNIAALLAESGTPVWLYRHEHIVSFPDVFSRFGLPAECATRTCHAAELPFIFNNTVLNYTFTAAEQDMANSAVHYWTSFALSHDPNSDGTQSVKWPPFDRASRGALVLSTPVSTEFADASGALCGFWDSLGYGF